jgi:hypothetical protein
MTAASAVSPGRPTSLGPGGSQRNPMVFRRSRHRTSHTEYDMGCGGEWPASHRRVLAVSLAAGTLSVARIAMLTGVHHG